MKLLMMLVAVGAMTCAAVFAGEPAEEVKLTDARVKSIERSLIKALESDIPRLQITAALTLRRMRALAPEHDWDLCINPLMRVLNGEDHDAAARVVAAITLYELRSSRGDFAIVCNARFGDHPRVKQYCSILAETRRLEHRRH